MNIPGCSHFTLRDALLLPSWGVQHTPSPSEMANLIKTFQKLEQIRMFLGGNAINVHCAIRPILNCPGSPHHGESYNSFVGGATHSAHIVGLAVDWSPVGLSCDDAKALLLPKLEEFNVRMEDNGAGANWVHCDLAPVPPGGNRFFKP